MTPKDNLLCRYSLETHVSDHLHAQWGVGAVGAVEQKDQREGDAAVVVLELVAEDDVPRNVLGQIIGQFFQLDRILFRVELDQQLVLVNLAY